MRRFYFQIIFIVLLAFPFSVLKAQLCEGSLGDPVVNITFGSGTALGSPLKAATTSYRYANKDCPDDGFYTVINKSNACFGDSWHTVLQDHTGDANGYFMLINASFDPSDFYLDTVRGLCANTTYEFAAWILNMLTPASCNNHGIQPNITFSIENTNGTVLQSFNSGDIQSEHSPTWKQYGFFFITPPGVSTVVLRMTNNAPGGCGNDLAVDDITFRPCGPKVSAAVHGSQGEPVINVCETNTTSFVLDGNISVGYDDPRYQWQLSTDGGTSWSDISGATHTSLQITPTIINRYLYRITVANGSNIFTSTCRVASNAVTVNVNPNPRPQASSNSPVCESAGLMLTASQGMEYNWTGPNGFTANTAEVGVPNAGFDKAGKYYVQVISDKKCAALDSISVQVVAKPKATIIQDLTFCEGEKMSLFASGGSRYQWHPATGLSDTTVYNPVASPVDSTRYFVTVSNAASCNDTASVMVNVLKKPVAHAGADKKIMEGQSVQLDGMVAGTEISYYWTPLSSINDAGSLRPVVNPRQDTTYTLHVQSNIGCGTQTDDVFIRVFKKVVIPNAFSPNNDGINDTWKIEALETYPESDMTIFNRYGQIVYHSKGYPKAWDGKLKGNPLPVGTYYYKIDLKNNLPVLSGWVLIIK